MARNYCVLSGLSVGLNYLRHFPASHRFDPDRNPLVQHKYRPYRQLILLKSMLYFGADR
jgi:hypothetical protein